jgi:FKBP-type peptidyl-prolyl cis-trans isomerase
MKHNIFALFGFCIILSLTSCLSNEAENISANNEAEIQNYLKFKNLTPMKSPEGMYYSITTANPAGKTPAQGDLVKMYLKMSLLSGSIIDSTRKTLKQARGFVYYGGNSIYNLPLSTMKKGEKGYFILPSNLAFQGTSFDGLPAFSVIRIDLEIESIQTEQQQIDSMKVANKMTDAVTTSSGLVFKKLVQNPTGAEVKTGMTFSATYLGRFSYAYLQNESASSSNVIYDSKFDSGILTGSAGTGNLIKGFDEAILRMKVGEKAQFIIPSNIAYGTGGSSSGKIPGYAPLYFEVTITAAQ